MDFCSFPERFEWSHATILERYVLLDRYLIIQALKPVDNQDQPTKSMNNDLVQPLNYVAKTLKPTKKT